MSQNYLNSHKIVLKGPNWNIKIPIKLYQDPNSLLNSNENLREYKIKIQYSIKFNIWFSKRKHLAEEFCSKWEKDHLGDLKKIPGNIF